MSLLFQLVLLALFSCIGLTHGEQKYFKVDGIKTCDSKSSDLNSCLKDNAKVAWPTLLKGVKEFCVPPLDPFELRSLDFSYDGVALSGKLAAANVKVVGLSKLQLKSVDVKVSNKKKITLKAKFSVSQLKMTGSYTGQVRVTLLSLRPRGSFNLALEDVDVEANAEADVSSRDGHSFAKITELKVEPKIGNLNLEAKELAVSSFISRNVIKRINKDWKNYYGSVMPQTRKIWLPYIEKIINKLMNVTPLESVINI